MLPQMRGRRSLTNNLSLSILATKSRTLAATSATIALVYRNMRGRDPTAAVPGGSYTGDVLRMMEIVESGENNSKVEK